MTGAIYGATIGALFGVMLGWAPAVLGAGFLCIKGNGVVSFLPPFLCLWVTVTMLASAGAAAIGYAFGRAAGDE